MQKPIIWTDNVEITYNAGKSNEFKALQNINVEVIAQEYIILFGPSGCGKSTLLYSMFGVLPPQLGKVYVKGKSVYDLTPMELVHYQRKTMGIMYQQFNLIPSITVLDNVALPLIFAGVSSHKREKKAMQLLERFDIAHVANKRPGLLSGGQQQRVSVARSLVNDPEILIADEPVGNLDSISSKAVMDTLDQINLEDKKTILLVTHDAKHLPYAHRIFYLKDGFLDRIVPNPEKPQVKKLEPGETIITEIEQIQRIYPYDTPKMLRVKSVINYLTQSLTFDQILRLEKVSQDMIDGRIGEGVFREKLSLEYGKGGVGLKKEVSDEMAHKMRKILEQSVDVARYRKLRKRVTLDTTHHEIIQRIRAYLMIELNTHLTAMQSERLSVVIANRLAGYTKKDDFRDQIELPLEENGVGIDKHASHDLTRYLEKLIAQGVHGPAGERGSKVSAE